MDNTEEFRCISLCSGYAGIELGLERVISNFRTVCYVEVEAFAVANLVAKIEEGKLDAAPVWTDIKTFDDRPFRNRIHIITAGYPCQPFSVAGKRKGKKDHRHLWPHIERIIKTVKPLWFFGENVSGHLTLGFPTVYRSLRNLGYSVEAGLFTAAECGAPHIRERLFILAHTIQRTMCSRPSQNKSVLQKWSLLQKKPHKQSCLRSNIRSCFRTLWPPRPEKVSKIPRMDDGNRKELDRLRLLGNGVVPQCAELAFRTLIEKFNANSISD